MEWEEGSVELSMEVDGRRTRSNIWPIHGLLLKSNYRNPQVTWISTWKTNRVNNRCLSYAINIWILLRAVLSRISKLYIFLIDIGGSDTADHPDSELDSGISVNGNYDQIETPSRNGGQQQHMRHIKGLQDYERIEEMHGKFLKYHIFK